MQQIDVFTGTENWLSDVLVAARPLSDQMFEPSIAFFRWDGERVLYHRK